MMDMRTKRAIALVLLGLGGVLLAMGSIPGTGIHVNSPVLGSMTLGQIVGFAVIGITIMIYKRWVRVQ